MKKLLYIIIPIVLFSTQCKKDKKITTTADTKFTAKFEYQFGGNPIVSNEYCSVPKSDGEFMSFSSMNLLLSQFALVKMDSSLILLDDGYQFVSNNNFTNRTSFTYKDEKYVGSYKGICFKVGCDSVINHGDPAVWPTNHPMNINVNNMHWGWAGGYIFQALDGSFKADLKATNSFSFSYHTATDKLTRNYFIPFNFSIEKGSNKTAKIILDLKTAFEGINLKTLSINHSTGTAEMAGMQQLLNYQKNAFKLTSVQ